MRLDSECHFGDTWTALVVFMPHLRLISFDAWFLKSMLIGGSAHKYLAVIPGRPQTRPAGFLLKPALYKQAQAPESD